LQAHHRSTSEIWLVFHKRHTAEASLGYDDAIEEARHISRTTAGQRPRVGVFPTAGAVLPAGLHRVDRLCQRDATKAKRLSEAASLLQAGQKPGN
jgi:hypothetical protein